AAAMATIDPEIPAGGRYRHPLGWYELVVPPGWVVDPSSDPARFLGPDAEAVGVVSVAKTAGLELPAARSRFLRRAMAGMAVIERSEAQEGKRDGLSWARSEEVV